MSGQYLSRSPICTLASHTQGGSSASPEGVEIRESDTRAPVDKDLQNAENQSKGGGRASVHGSGGESLHDFLAVQFS